MKRTLSHILTSEGRVVCDDDGNFDYYEYNLKDHLGNTRVVFTEDDGVIKNNDYYPFGMIMGGTDAQPVDGDNKFLYNGKEYINNTDLNLGWYDYGARFYDPQLGRWHSVDPLAELTTGISPYVYCYNNPISNIDPDGMLAYGNDYKEKKDYRHPEEFIVNRRFDNGKYGIRLPMHRPMYIGGPGLKRWLTKKFKGGKDYTVGQARKIWNNFKPSVDEIDIAEVPVIATRKASSSDDASSNGGSWTDGLSDWWNSTEFYFESGGDVSLGVQAGAGFEVNDTKLKVQANLASMTLLSGSARQVGSDTAPWEFNGRYIGKNGITNVKQSIAIPLLGYEHSFDTYGEGYIYGTEVHQFNVGPAVGNNQGVYRLKLGVGAAFILGVNGYVEFGVRPR